MNPEETVMGIMSASTLGYQQQFGQTRYLGLSDHAQAMEDTKTITTTRKNVVLPVETT